jgi:transposase
MIGFRGNIGKRLSIEEITLFNGELYTILTSKAAKDKNRTPAAIIAGSTLMPLLQSSIKSLSNKEIKPLTLHWIWPQTWD